MKRGGTFDQDAALMRLPPDARVIERKQVQKAALILGGDSQAAQALARAESHSGPVRFWYSSKLSMLWLELIEDMRN